MKIASLIARILLGAIFVFGGSNHLFNFVPAQPLPPARPGQFLAGMIGTGYLDFIGVMRSSSVVCSSSFSSSSPWASPSSVPSSSISWSSTRSSCPKHLPVAIVLIFSGSLGAWPFRSIFFPLLQRKISA